jgi:uncharacterized protein YcfJ
MRIKRHAALALLLPLAAGTAAAHGPRHVNARVVVVQPVYETFVVETPVTTCHTEMVDRAVGSPRVAGQTLAGAIVGAAIGRQFGDGNGRDALTVLGAVAGSAVAHQRAVRLRGGVTVVSEPVERCTTEIRRHTESRITAYWVEYRHRGRNHRVLSAYDPGPEIRIVSRS